MPATNPHEQRNREAKIQRMLREVDRLAAYAGLSRGDSYAIADMLEAWPESRWIELAVSVGSRPPSKTTKDEVVARIRRRAS